MEEEQETLRSAMKNNRSAMKNLPKLLAACTSSDEQSEEFRFVHNDLKLENILFGKFSNEQNPGCKIIDLGFSRLPEHKVTMCGTVGNLSPELVHARIQPNVKALFKYTQAADMWNIGMVLSVLLNVNYYFSGEDITKEARPERVGGKTVGRVHRWLTAPPGGVSRHPNGVDHNYLSAEGQKHLDLHALGRAGLPKKAALPRISQKILRTIESSDQGRRDFFHAIQRDLKNSFGKPDEFKKTFAHFLLGGEKAEDIATSTDGWNACGEKMDRWGGLLNGNPVKRLDVNQALSHPWLVKHSVGLVSDRFRGAHAVGEFDTLDGEGDMTSSSSSGDESVPQHGGFLKQQVKQGRKRKMNEQKTTSSFGAPWRVESELAVEPWRREPRAGESDEIVLDHHVEPMMAELNLGLGSLFDSADQEAALVEQDLFPTPSVFKTTVVLNTLGVGNKSLPDHEEVQEPATKVPRKTNHESSTTSSLSLTSMGARMGIYDQGGPRGNTAQQHEDEEVASPPGQGGPEGEDGQDTTDMLVHSLSSDDGDLFASPPCEDAEVEEGAVGVLDTDPYQQYAAHTPSGLTLSEELEAAILG